MDNEHEHLEDIIRAGKALARDIEYLNEALAGFLAFKEKQKLEKNDKNSIHIREIKN